MDGPPPISTRAPRRRIARLDPARLEGGERAEDADQDKKRQRQKKRATPPDRERQTSSQLLPRDLRLELGGRFLGGLPMRRDASTRS